MLSVDKDPSMRQKVQRAFNHCPRCGRGPMVVDGETGELLCSNCGFVRKERIEEVGPDWRSFSDGEKDNKRRTGLPTSIAEHDIGTSTMIGRSDHDASGKSLVGPMKSTVERMRTWDRRSQVHLSTDVNLRRAFDQLRTLAEKLAVSQEVVERAAYIYRKALERGLIRGRSITTITAASLYAACRDEQIPRSLKDVSSVSNVPKKEGSHALLQTTAERDGFAHARARSSQICVEDRFEGRPGREDEEKGS